jgi:hypothetical protein
MNSLLMQLDSDTRQIVEDIEKQLEFQDLNLESLFFVIDDDSKFLMIR